MRTSNSMSPGQAAKAVGKGKSTIIRAIHAGELTAFRDEDERYWIDPAELARVYPDTFKPNREPDHDAHHEPVRPGSLGRSSVPSKLLQAGSNDTMSGPEWIASLKAELGREREERTRERDQQQETIDDLRTRLDASEAARERATTQLTSLLTDQREKAAPAPTKPRRWWHLSGA